MPRIHKRKPNCKPGTQRRRDHYSRAKTQLISDLGGKCVECNATENLTFDHIYGATWNYRKVHSTKRLRLYREEARQGLLQLLCGSCNSRKKRPEECSDEPF